jgi:predicted PurR-regulated permease PerM
MTSPKPTADSVLAPDVEPTLQATRVDPVAPTPDLERTQEALRSSEGRSVGVTVLVVLAILYTLFFARDFLLPVVVAMLLDFLFSPVVRALARFRVPPPAAAGLVIIVLLGAVAGGTYQLSGPVQRWVSDAPQTFSRASGKLRTLLRPVERVTKTAEQVASATSSVTPGPPPKATEVVVKGPSLVSRIFGTTQRFLAGVVEVLVLLYFLLAAGDLFLQKLIKVLPNFRHKKTAVEIARATEASVSTYLLTAAAVNVGEGLVVTAALWLLGMPNAPLWGALIAILEFVPYLGAFTMLLVLSVAALTTFDNVLRALLVPATFLLINVLQAYFISPLLLGRRLTLNPVAIVVGLAFWWWIWGVPGAFLAVPMLATFKIICDHIAALAPIGEFLGARDAAERRWTARLME